MGFSIGGTSSRSSSSFDEELDSLTEEELARQQQQQQTETGSTSTTGKETGTAQTTSELSSLINTLQQQDVSTLDAGTQQLLQTLLQSAGDADQLSALQGAFTSKALTAEEDLNASNAAILDAARLQTDRDVGRAKTTLARGAGSSQNSLVQQLGLEATTDAEVQLRGLEASLQQQNKQIGLDALRGGVSGTSEVVAQLASILKGATQSTTVTGSEAAQQTELASQLSELLQSSDSESINQLVALLEEAQQSTSATEQTASGSSSSRGRSVGVGFSG